VTGDKGAGEAVGDGSTGVSTEGTLDGVSEGSIDGSTEVPSETSFVGAFVGAGDRFSIGDTGLVVGAAPLTKTLRSSGSVLCLESIAKEVSSSESVSHNIRSRGPSPFFLQSPPQRPKEILSST